MSSKTPSSHQSRLSDDLPNWRQIDPEHWAWRGEQYCHLRVMQETVLQDHEKFNQGVTPAAERWTLLAYTRELPTDQYLEIGEAVTAVDAREQIIERAERWMAAADGEYVQDLHDEVTRETFTRCGCGRIVAKTNRNNHLPGCPLNPDAETNQGGRDVQ